MKILLLEGGWSAERDVSLAGAKNIAEALERLGHEVTRLDFASGFDRLATLAARHDFVFINLHGSPGEDGLPQAILERIGCPYQGSDATSSFLALNKAAAKQIYRLNGIPTPDWEFLPSMPAASWTPALAWPIFVKSNTGGSSLGLYKTSSLTELRKAMEDIFARGDCVIMETCVQGRELSCGVLGDNALAPVLIEPVMGEYFDYESKYQKGGAREICPAPIESGLLENCRTLALKAHAALGLYGVSRTDMILSDDGNFMVLETNTLPGMTKTSIVPAEAAQTGLDFDALIAELIRLGLARAGKDQIA